MDSYSKDGIIALKDRLSFKYKIDTSLLSLTKIKCILVNEDITYIFKLGFISIKI